MHRNFKQVSRVVFGRGCFDQLADILKEKRTGSKKMVFLVDHFFKGKDLEKRIPLQGNDELIFIDVTYEPTTSDVDKLRDKLISDSDNFPDGIIGIGGGSTMDVAKAVSLMLTNEGKSHEYQGWDLIKKPGVYKVGIPTLSGTGAEVSRTCVLTGPVRKLGLNSDHTVYDQMVLDPELIKNIPKDQWFYTGMDCFIHNIEALKGTFINEFARAFGEKSQALCEQVFLEDHPDSDDKLMMASYFGGMSIAYSQVGACHALSYGLAFVLGVKHGIGNCLAFNQLGEFYPEGVEKFKKMMDKHKIELPVNITKNLTSEQFDQMAEICLGLDPLWENALGKDWKKIMTKEKVLGLYKKI
ncbi:MAG: iron-containing alcohol dehydrogenase family protein [Desulforegulaceae bacterium]|nr:iron-containing alcohol dehydrogenase family protein [Desulforegulaceae bacterium]